MVTMNKLDAAYQATTYRVFLPGGLCDLRLGQASEVLRCWLETAEASSFAILTAHNPGSKQLDQALNMERQSEMELELLENGYEPFSGENVADADDWPDEETCFVLDIELSEVCALAAKYGQSAAVHGTADGVPHLVWIEK